MMTGRGAMLIILCVTLLITIVSSDEFDPGEHPVNEEIFKGVTSGNDDVENEPYGVIGVVDYGNDILHSWTLYPPGISPNASKDYTFIFNITMMDLEITEEYDGQGEEENTNGGSSLVKMHVGQTPDLCADDMSIGDNEFCGRLGHDDQPYTVIEYHVPFMKVHFSSDGSVTRHGFLASYEWRDN